MSGHDPHHRIRRLLRTSASLAFCGCAAYWLWLQGASVAEWLVSMAALLGAAWLGQTSRPARRALSVGLQSATLIAVLLGLHGAVPVGEGALARLGEGSPKRALLCVSVFGSLYALFLLGRSSLAGRVSFVGLWVRSASSARAVAGVLLVAVLAFVSSELFFLGDGARFDYRSAKHHPLFAFRMPGTYMYSHATERQVADMHQHAFEQRKPDDVVRIVLNGASTMAGFGLDAKQRPAEVLRSHLAGGLGGKRVEVILLGVSGKYQVNELIDTVVTLPHWSPDIVISFNGYNEINWGETSGHYEGMPYTAGEIDQVLNVPPALGVLFANSHLGAALWKRRWFAPWPGREWLHEPLAYEPPRYYGYLRRTARNLADLHIPYVYAFCPNVFAWKQRMTDAALSPAVLESFAEKAAKARSKAIAPSDTERRAAAAKIVTAEGQIAYPVMDLVAKFRNVDDVFLDDCHFTRRGVEAVMGDLARKIPSLLEEWNPPRPGAPASPTPQVAVP